MSSVTLCNCIRVLAFISSLLYLYPALVASTTISRSLLKSTRIITLSPSQPLLRQYRAVAEASEKEQRLNGCCDEVMDSPEFLYIPSLLTLDAASIEGQREDVTDDDHCVSRLCDLGFTVHSLDFLGPIEGRQWMSRGSERMKPFSFNSIVQAIDEAVQWHSSRSSRVGNLSKQSQQSSLHLIAKEVSVLHVLHYLSEVAMPRSKAGDHYIKGVVLLDPPPMQAVGTEEGRLQVLKRYVLPLVAASSFEEEDERLGGGYCDPMRKRLADDRRLAVEDAKHRLLLLQYRNYLDNMGELGVYLEGLSVELFRRPESALPAYDITEDAWSPLLSITEDAQLLREIDQFYQQLSIDNNADTDPSGRPPAKRRKQLQPLFARDTALFSPTAGQSKASHRSAAAAVAQSSQYYDPTTSAPTSKMLLGSQCPRRCVELARSLHPKGGVTVVNSAFLDRKEACWQHSADTALAALMGHDHRREEDDDDSTLDAADEWGLESMQELARLYQVGTGDESNFVDLLGRRVVGGGTGRSKVSTVARAIADTVLTRILLRYL